MNNKIKKIYTYWQNNMQQNNYLYWLLFFSGYVVLSMLSIIFLLGIGIIKIDLVLPFFISGIFIFSIPFFLVVFFFDTYLPITNKGENKS